MKIETTTDPDKKTSTSTVTTDITSQQVQAVLQNAIAGAMVPNSKFKTAGATAGANGFIASQVVTEGYIQANSSPGQQYDFCLRQIDYINHGQLSDFSISELNAILDPDGCNLAMMPLIKFAKKDDTDTVQHYAKIIMDRLQGLGLPIDITIWFDDSNLKAVFTKSSGPTSYTSVKDILANLTRAGYSIGYYGGDGCACSPSNSAMHNGATVLNTIDCGAASVPSKTFPMVSIGDNSNACKLRWIIPQ